MANANSIERRDLRRHKAQFNSVALMKINFPSQIHEVFKRFHVDQIAAVLLAVCAGLLALAALSLVRARKDCRSKLAEAEGGEGG